VGKKESPIQAHVTHNEQRGTVQEEGKIESQKRTG